MCKLLLFSFFLLFYKKNLTFDVEAYKMHFLSRMCTYFLLHLLRWFISCFPNLLIIAVSHSRLLITGISPQFSDSSQNVFWAHLGILQRRLIAGGSVVNPLRGVGVNVSQVKLLHQVVQVVVQVLFLQPQQLKLVHGEVQASAPVAVADALVAPQVVTHVRLPGSGVPRGAFTGAVQFLTEIFSHRRRVTHNLSRQHMFISTIHCKKKSWF